MSPTLMDHASPVAVLGPTVDVVNDATLTALSEPRAGAAMQSPGLLRLGIDQRGGRSDASISSSDMSGFASAPGNAESPSLESSLDNDTEFQRWLDAEQQQDSAPNSNRLNRPLEDSGDDSGADDQREAKRPKVPSTAERGKWLQGFG
jgi:hypothetical protein